jgi:hypothetical protein
MGYSMRTRQHRYTEWIPREESSKGADYKEVELYDYKADANESVNIAPKNPQLVKDLSAKLKAGWRAAKPA